MIRLLTVVLLTGLAVFGTAIPAFAHNVLIQSDPRDGSQLSDGPSQVSLTFDLPIQEGDFDVVTVTGPDGGRWEAGAAAVHGVTMTAPVRQLGPAGSYTIGYRILSADGHPVSGAVRFTLTRAGTGTPATGQSSAGAGSSATAVSESSTPIWPWLVAGAVLLVIGLVIALRLGRRDDNRTAKPDSR